MPVTRSSRRAVETGVALVAASASRATSGTAAKRGRKPKSKPETPPSSIDEENLPGDDSAVDVAVDAAPVLVAIAGNGVSPIPAVLSFSFEDAKTHLVSVDNRFAELFRKMKCKPYEHLEPVDPFRTLVTSILGQQISWLAARSVIHKFVRIYDPSMPEKPAPYKESPKQTFNIFPTPAQVLATDTPTLRTAGLSGRKAEYVQDLSKRFATGLLTTEAIQNADDEELSKMLLEVRGIGRWTVDMFAIFSLRRPDILPVGDLGVQRGVLRWFLSLHSPKDGFTLNPKKLPVPDDDEEPEVGSDTDDSPDGTEVANGQPPSTPKKPGTSSSSIPVPPTPFTPSINDTLMDMGEDSDVIPLPEGITVPVLKSRLDGKKVKGAFLTPSEMESLTASWRPYRSLGVYYMWALAEEAQTQTTKKKKSK